MIYHLYQFPHLSIPPPRAQVKRDVTFYVHLCTFCILLLTACGVGAEVHWISGHAQDTWTVHAFSSLSLGTLRDGFALPAVLGGAGGGAGAGAGAGGGGGGGGVESGASSSAATADQNLPVVSARALEVLQLLYLAAATVVHLRLCAGIFCVGLLALIQDVRGAYVDGTAIRTFSFVTA